MEFKEIQNTTINDLSSDTAVVGKDLLLLARQNFTKRNVVDREFPYYSFKTSVSELSAATEFALVHKNENVKGCWTFNNPVSVDNYKLSGKVDNNVVASKWYADRMEKDITDRIYALSNYLYDEENPHIPSYVGMIVVTSIKDEKRIKEIYGGNKWQLTCQNRFLVGASKTASEYLLDHKGGHNSIKLKASQCGVPFHVHNISISNTQSFNTADYSHGLPQITPNKNPHRKHSHLHDYLIAAGVCAAIVAVIVVGTVCTAGTGGPGLFSAGGSAIASALGATTATVGATAAAAATFVATAVLTAAVTTALTYLGQQILIKTTELSMESINQWLAGAQLVASVITLGYGLYQQLGELATDIAINDITRNITGQIIGKSLVYSAVTANQLYGIYKQIKQVKHPSNQRMHFSQTYKQFGQKKYWIDLAKAYLINIASGYLLSEIRTSISESILDATMYSWDPEKETIGNWVENNTWTSVYGDKTWEVYYPNMTDQELINLYYKSLKFRDQLQHAYKKLETLNNLAEKNGYTKYEINSAGQRIGDLYGISKEAAIENIRSAFGPDGWGTKRYNVGIYKDDAGREYINLGRYIREQYMHALQYEYDYYTEQQTHLQLHMSGRQTIMGYGDVPLRSAKYFGSTSGMQTTMTAIENDQAANTRDIAARSMFDQQSDIDRQYAEAQGSFGDAQDAAYSDLTPEQKEELFRLNFPNSRSKSIKISNNLLQRGSNTTATQEEGEEDRGTDAVDPRTTFWTKSIGKCPITVSIPSQKGFLTSNTSASATKSIDLRPRYYRVYIWKRIS